MLGLDLVLLNQSVARGLAAVLRARIASGFAFVAISSCVPAGDQSKSSPDKLGMTLKVDSNTVWITAVGRKLRLFRIAITRSRMDTLGAGGAIPVTFDSGRVLDARRLRDTAFVLLELGGPTPGTFECPSSPHREMYLTWIRIPVRGPMDAPPLSVRYSSCWERARTTGVHQNGDSVWTETEKEARGGILIAATYDRRHAERGMAVRQVITGWVELERAKLEEEDRKAQEIKADEAEKANTPVPMLLAPADVKQVPESVRDGLAKRECRVPYLSSGPDTVNVFRGDFLGTGSKDTWAIWCITPDTSIVLFFRDGIAAPVNEFAVDAGFPRQPTYDPDPQGGRGHYGCVGRLHATETSRKYLNESFVGGDSLTDAERKAPPHDGIEDMSCEGASGIHYWTGRKWVMLPGQN